MFLQDKPAQINLTNAGKAKALIIEFRFAAKRIRTLQQNKKTLISSFILL